MANSVSVILIHRRASIPLGRRRRRRRVNLHLVGIKLLHFFEYYVSLFAMQTHLLFSTSFNGEFVDTPVNI